MGNGDPVDSLAEVKRYGLNPRYTNCCAEPEGTKVAGCGMHQYCDIEVLEGKGGKDDRPCLLGIQIGKPTADGLGAITKNEIVRCHTYIRIREEIEANGGAIVILAREGEPIAMQETHSVPDPTSPTGFKTTPRTEDKIVPHHERLADLPAYRNRVTLDRRRADIAKRQRQEKARTVGIDTSEADEAATEAGG